MPREQNLSNIFPNKQHALVAVASQKLHSCYLLLFLLLGLALAIGVGGTLLAGLNKLSTLEAVVAASSLLVLISSCRLPLLLLLFTRGFFGFPNKSIVQRQTCLMEAQDEQNLVWDASLTSWKWRWASCHSLCTPSLLFHTPL